MIITLDLPEVLAQELLHLSEAERVILLHVALEARTLMLLSHGDPTFSRLGSLDLTPELAGPGEGVPLLNWETGEQQGTQVACTTGGYYLCDLPVDGSDHPHTRLRFFAHDVKQALPLPLYQERGAFTDLMLRAKKFAEKHRQERGDVSLSAGQHLDKPQARWPSPVW